MTDYVTWGILCHDVTVILTLCDVMWRHFTSWTGEKGLLWLWFSPIWDRNAVSIIKLYRTVMPKALIIDMNALFFFGGTCALFLSSRNTTISRHSLSLIVHKIMLTFIISTAGGMILISSGYRKILWKFCKIVDFMRSTWYFHWGSGLGNGGWRFLMMLLKVDVSYY